MKTITIEGQVRGSLGTAGAKQLRREGLVPCVVYGNQQVIHLAAPQKSFKDLLSNPGKSIAHVVVDGKSYRSIVKETQYHPLSDALLHVDFLELVDGKTILTDLPVKTVGKALGVAAGGKLLNKVRRLKVKLKPEQLVEFLEADVTSLELGKSYRVGDLMKTVTGIEIMHAPSIPIATVEIPRALKSAQTADAKVKK